MRHEHNRVVNTLQPATDCNRVVVHATARLTFDRHARQIHGVREPALRSEQVNYLLPNPCTVKRAVDKENLDPLLAVSRRSYCPVIHANCPSVKLSCMRSPT